MKIGEVEKKKISCVQFVLVEQELLASEFL